MFQYVSTSPQDTARIAKLIGERLPEGMIFCLDGDLGAGKTLFVQNLAKGMGIADEVTSPTFNIRRKIKILEEYESYISIITLFEILQITTK